MTNSHEILQKEREVMSLMRDQSANSLLTFTVATMPTYRVAKHHKLIAKKLEAVARGEIKRLMIFMPPRHGKSELVSVRFPAWTFGLNPDCQIIGTSYGADLASKMNRSIQSVMDMPIYREIFPATKLNSRQTVTTRQALRNSNVFEIVHRRGYYRSAGIGGAMTGTGADILLIDDPIKNQKEADSLTFRNAIYDWYTSTAYTRLEKDGAIVLVQTRWHEDDLCGRLLDLAKSNPEADQWDVLSLEAVKETLDHEGDKRELGDALWPWKYDVDRLNKIKHSAGTRVWNALYQQKPSALEGSTFKKGWMKFYKEKPARFDRLIQSWDAAFSKSDTSDYVVGQVWGRVGAEFYLLDQVRARMDFPETKKMIKTMTGKWPNAFKKIVEKKANGAALIDDLAKDVMGLVPYSPTESKESRANSVSPLFEAGNVYLPDPSIAPWVHDYITELTSFPNASNDDQVDATTQALIELRESGDWLQALSRR